MHRDMTFQTGLAEDAGSAGPFLFNQEMVIFTEKSKCIYEGQPVSPDMPGCCNRCVLYLETCLPIIRNGFLVGAECDMEYCEYCPAYGGCIMYFAVEGGHGYAEKTYGGNGCGGW